MPLAGQLAPLMKRTPISLCILLLCLGTQSPLRGAPPVTAREVFERHFTALGGRETILKLRSVTIEGTAREGEQPFHFVFQLKPPGLFLLTASNSQGFVVRSGRDANARCWRQSPRGVQDAQAKDAGEFMDLAIGFLLPGQPGLFDLLTNAPCAAVEEDGRPAIAVGHDDPASPFPRLVFDQQSGLLVRAGRTGFTDYRPVDGLQLPHATHADQSVRLEVARARFNDPLPDSLFARPDGPTRMAEVPAALKEHTLLSRPGQLEIVRRPPPADFHRGRLDVLPAFDPNSPRHAQVDLRGYDLTRLDVSTRLQDLLHADFDSVTRWPQQLPAGYDRQRILELGRDPGLRVRELHRRGITGRGVGLGIIDQPLLVDHAEYRDRLRLYEEVHSPAEAPAQMHGPAVASIAVGKSLGVAPGADLYYIAEQHGTFKGEGQFDWDFTWLAQSLHRMLDVNASLPASAKIRVISISVGWSPNQKGYAEAMAAVQRATRDRVFVVSTALEATHQLKFHGLGREPLSDPNDPASFGPGSWWAGMFWGGQFRFGPGERLLVPMDSRATASPTAPDHTVFYYSAGWSWAVPWIAGLYALGCEAYPELTPELFWAKALETGRTIRIQKGTETLEFGTIADPVALIDGLKSRSVPNQP